ncbi:hypothetical protein E2P81_ATG05102 [Venturia nashicola]|uniref:Uncharacterized protein n=1 Tax=Venturia nashicola TaxID=86259 RepID=A0A4Z1PG04_9PEZI|nr:hypothetical protein E6O75_ATG05230 [Venturia nashicola]TLD34937.1 hypothetical protein E2P81_ATG05102 [Venturia nashicola]
MSSTTGLVSFWSVDTSSTTLISTTVPASTTHANGSVAPILTPFTSMAPSFTPTMVPTVVNYSTTLPWPTISPATTSTSMSTTRMPSADMMQGFTSCYDNWDTWYATADPALSLGDKERKSFEKKERRRLEQHRTRCVYDRCMEGATKSCTTTSTTATTTVMWNAIQDPAQTPFIASKLSFISAVPRTQAYYTTAPWEDRGSSSFLPMPWNDRRMMLNKTELKASDKFFGTANWTEVIAQEYIYPATFHNCSFEADSYLVKDDPQRFNQYLGKKKTLDSCNSPATCERRCAALAGIKDPKKWKMPVIVTFSILGGIFLLASLCALACCLRKRRVPRSRLPRQPTVHDPEPSMAQAPARTPIQTPTQSPRVVQTTAPAPVPAPAPTPSPAFTPAPVDSAGQPVVVEQTESAPGAGEEVVEVVPSTAPAQVVSRAPTTAPPQVVSRVPTTAPTQVVSRAPTGAS